MKGTRVMVSVVLDCMASGMSKEEVTQEYPSVTQDHVLAALAYASELAKEQVVAA